MVTRKHTFAAREAPGSARRGFQRAGGMMLIAALCMTAALQALPGEAARREGWIAEGTAWQTPYTVVESWQPGPTVLITGGLHGDEPAGAMAAEQMRHWPAVRGRLVVVPRCNVPGLEQGSRRMPGVEADVSDPNRNFPKSGGPDEAVTELCRHLWEFVRQCAPDWLVDLHEGYGFRGAGSKSVGSSIIACRHDEAKRLRARMIDAVNATIADPKKKLVSLGPPVNGSLARACAEHLGTKARSEPGARQMIPRAVQWCAGRNILPPPPLAGSDSPGASRKAAGAPCASLAAAPW